MTVIYKTNSNEIAAITVRVGVNSSEDTQLNIYLQLRNFNNLLGCILYRATITQRMEEDL